MSFFAMTDAGLQTETEEEIKTRLIARLRATHGTNLDFATESILGQFANMFAEELAKTQQVTLAVYNANNPASNSGAAQDVTASYTGTLRKGSTASTDTVQAAFNAAGTISDGDLFSNDDNETVWSVVNGPYTDTGGPYPESVDVGLQAVETGPTLAQAGTTWSKVTANADVDGITNAADDADVGRDAETAVDFRIRRLEEIYALGQGPRKAIQGALSRVAGVDTARVYHNTSTQPVDSNGIPFKAFNVVLETTPAVPTSTIQQAVWDTILQVTGAGGEAYGTDYVGTSEDIEGESQPVAFDVITRVPVYIQLRLDTSGTEFTISENLLAVVEAFILAQAPLRFGGIGRNQIDFEYAGLVSELQKSGEISGVTSVEVNLSLTSLGGTPTDPVEIGPRERPVFDSPRIEVVFA